ncbi:MAG: hypothetical protein ACFFD1_16195 [Candidatus Thorarchaeota archaeon]
MSRSKLKFCPECGTLLENNKICLKCTPFISKDKKRDKIGENDERKLPQRFFTKKTYNLNDKTKIKKNSQKFSKKETPRRSRTVAIYSEDKGLELGWDLDTPEKQGTRAVFCIKCKQPRANWEGLWIIPGGKGRSLDPDVKPRRVFLCGTCWSPYKSRRGRISIEEIGLPEDELFNPQ